MTEHLSVTVNVPADRLAEFHQMFGQWLSNGPSPTPRRLASQAAS